MQHARFIGSIALTAFLFAGVASAQPAQQTGASGAPAPRAAQSASQSMPTAGDQSDAPSFADLDKDNKGYIRRGDVPKDNEALKQLRAHFNEADQNHDGRVDKSEYDAYINKNKAPAQH